MEKEQLEKKVAWLDAERRKAVATVAELEKRLAALEKKPPKGQGSAKSASQKALDQQIVELEKDLKALRAETKKQVQELENAHSEQSKALHPEQKGLSKVLEDFRKETGQLQAQQKSLITQRDQIDQLTGTVERLEESLAEISKGEARRTQLANKLEESSKEDAKRLTEMRAEVAASLNRLEAAAKQVEKVLLSNRKMEKRVDELTAVEEQRKVEQNKFLEAAALEQTERDRTWKEWEKRFQLVEQQAGGIAAHLKDIETTDLAVKRAQRAFDELVDKINRRINELGEIQRLGDQRFRGEWSTFQADAQKRWSSFTLSHEEQQREGLRQREKLSAQLTQVEDSLREVQDNLQHFSEQSERNLQALLELARDSLAENERFLSNQR